MITQFDECLITSTVFFYVTLAAVSPSAPRFTSSPAPSVAIQVGANVTLECAADGSPVPRLTWTRLGDETPLATSSGSATSGSRYIVIFGMSVKFDTLNAGCRENLSVELSSSCQCSLADSFFLVI
jgi:Immunoglobulin domain